MTDTIYEVDVTPASDLAQICYEDMPWIEARMWQKDWQPERDSGEAHSRYLRFIDEDCIRLARLLEYPCKPGCKECAYAKKQGDWLRHNWSELEPLMEEI